MRWSYAMMSPRVTSPVEKEGADVDRVDQDAAKRVGGAADPDCPRPKLHLAPFNGSSVYGTHVGKVVGR